MRAAGRSLAVAALALAFAFVAACGDDGPPSGKPVFPTVLSLGEGDVFVNITNTFIVTGENRVSMRLTDSDDEPLLGAEVRVGFYDLNGEEPRLVSDGTARFVPVTLSYVDELSGGETAVTGEDGVYVREATFDEAGAWGAWIRVTHEGEEYDPFPFRFTVADRDGVDVLLPGDAAPASVQRTTATAPIEEIDSSFPPRPDMHDVTVADALAAERPLVVAFATPAFCRSRTCAPVMDTVIDPLAEEYGDRAEFIHIEPYVLGDLRAANIETPVPAALEWRIRTEPVVYVVGADGVITAVFEGPVAFDEVEDALTAVISP